MKIVRYILLLFLSAELLCSCEKILYIEDTTSDKLVLNGIACADTLFSLSIAKSYNYWEMAQMPQMDFWRYEMRYRYGSEPAYKGDAVLSGAKAFLTVNGKEQIPLSYDYFNYSYRCNYSPKAGDRLEVRVDMEKYRSAKVEFEIPEPSKIEVVSYEKVYSRIPQSDVNSISDIMAKDTVARITLKITDPADKSNYYRLKVRGYSQEYAAMATYFVTDIFSSDDIIFRDDQLNKEYRGWPACFSNIFTDQIFDGKEYNFVVESRLRSGKSGNQPIIVELQTITKELYYYLKSTMLYRISDQDAYTEPIIITGNVQNGLGIVGGASTYKQVIHL